MEGPIFGILRYCPNLTLSVFPPWVLKTKYITISVDLKGRHNGYMNKCKTNFSSVCLFI